MVTTLRGDPEGRPDEPQHEMMGRITNDLFDLIEIDRGWFPKDRGTLARSLVRARERMDEHGQACALVVRKGTLASGGYQACMRPPRTPDAAWSTAAIAAPRARHSADRVLAALRETLGADVALVATTGFTGRALLALGDAPSHFYMVGSMGCAPSLALGIARAKPDRRIVVLDGDGALLMRLGALATIGHERPANLVHVLLDNGVHDSTGAQQTVSPGVDFCAIAGACGYARTTAIGELDELPGALEGPGPLFVHVSTEPRSDRELPRPRLQAPEIARRFRDWLEVGSDHCAP